MLIALSYICLVQLVALHAIIYCLLHVLLIPYCTSNHIYYGLLIVYDAVSCRFLAAVSVKKLAAAVIRTCGREAAVILHVVNDDVQLLP